MGIELSERTKKLADLEEPKPLTTDDRCIISTTTNPTPCTPEGKRISRYEFFRRLRNDHEDRFSKLIIPCAEPLLSAEIDDFDLDLQRHRLT